MGGTAIDGELCDGEGIVEVDATEGGLRAGDANGCAESAEDLIDAKIVGVALEAFKIAGDIGDAIREVEIGPASHESANLSDIRLAGEELEEVPANEASGPGEEDGSVGHVVFRVRLGEGSARS